jgi:hypothetical protein
MEAALVSFNDSAFVNRADGLSKLFFKFDKLGVMGSTAQLRLRFLLLVFCPDHWLLFFKFDTLGVMGSTAQLRRADHSLVCQNCFSSLTNSVWN